MSSNAYGTTDTGYRWDPLTSAAPWTLANATISVDDPTERRVTAAIAFLIENRHAAPTERLARALVEVIMNA